MIPLLLIGLWCSPVRWQLDNTFLIYSRGGCMSGDNFLRVTRLKLESRYALCDVTKVASLGRERWVSSGEMAYSAWTYCRDQQTSWKQKVTFLENDYMKVLTDWVEYLPNYEGRGRSLIQW
jgi:hypothetical protein